MVPHLSVMFDLGAVSAEPVQRHLLVALHRGLRDSVLRAQPATLLAAQRNAGEELLDKAEEQYTELDEKGDSI